MNQAKAIKRHAAQHDLFNRIHSIAADEQFVRKVAHDWFDDRFEVVANQRCGTWYCDPSTSSTAYAYFKSTDGHTLNWDFNLRRSNLSFASHAEKVGGVILVDSTRRGKRMPDGLSKTVPIWCAVVNRALQIRRAREGQAPLSSWDTSLYLPGQIVSPSERAQIEERLDAWAEDLEQSVLPLPDLKKPIRPFFVHPATSVPPHVPPEPEWTPIICVSASRWVNDGEAQDIIPTATRVGDGVFSRTVAFDYVPGAGDDDELWARGLKPHTYHAAKAELLSTSRDELPSLVDDIVRENDLARGLADVSLDGDAAQAPSLDQLWKSATPVSKGLLLDLGRTVGQVQASSDVRNGLVLRIVELDKPRKDAPYIIPVKTSAGELTVVGIPSSRARARDYLDALEDLAEYIETHLKDDSAVLLSPGSVEEYNAAVAALGSDDPPELAFTASRPTSVQLTAARKTILPLTVALLCSVPQLGGETEHVDKTTAADTLHTLVALWPDGNPPRAALKRVNEFLMSDR